MDMQQFDILMNVDMNDGEYVDDTILDILCLLIVDGVLTSDLTVDCCKNDPADFLKNLISASDLKYKDTLLALLASTVEHDVTMFISSDPDETSGEIMDRVIKLLLSLSCEEMIILRNKRHNSVFWIDLTNTFNSYFMKQGIAASLPLIIFACPKVFEIFKDSRFHDNIDQQAQDFVELFKRYYESVPLETIAFDERPYKQILHQCAKSGVSVSGWLERASKCLESKHAKPKYWMFEHLDSEVADMIMNKEGYYMLALNGDDVDRFETGEECHELRKYIVSNGFLRDVWNNYHEEAEKLYAYYEIDTRQEKSKSQTIRFFCFNNAFDGVNPLKLVFDFDPKSENEVYRFVSIDTIAEENYLLNIHRYNSCEYNMCKNPVFL